MRRQVQAHGLASIDMDDATAKTEEMVALVERAVPPVVETAAQLMAASRAKAAELIAAGGSLGAQVRQFLPGS